ncbi:MAG: hypothetical protein ACI867_000402 [Glaciecola sp.]|jgi:hypothetical protein
MAKFTQIQTGIRADFETFEIDLLIDLRDGIREALEHPNMGDPAMQRLFPPAITDDDVEDAAVRLQFHDSLLESRLLGLDALADIFARAEPRRGGKHRVVLVEDEAPLFLGVINDLRLALAARIGIEHVKRRDLEDDDPRAGGIVVLDHLAWLQEQLVRLLDPAASAHQDDPNFIARLESMDSDD